MSACCRCLHLPRHIPMRVSSTSLLQLNQHRKFRPRRHAGAVEVVLRPRRLVIESAAAGRNEEEDEPRKKGNPPPQCCALDRDAVEADSGGADRRTEVVIATVATVVLGVANRVLYKLALVPLKHYPFFLAQLATFG